VKKIKNNQQEKLIEKAMLDYNLATGCDICAFDNSYTPHIPEGISCYMETNICSRCEKLKPQGELCKETHIKAVKEASRKGEVYIYQCNLGFFFWTSPLYSESSSYTAIRCGGLLQEGQKTVDIFLNSNDNIVMRNSEVSKEEFLEQVNSSPTADKEKVKSLAEMLQLYAKSLSLGNEDYHEITKRRTEQQEAIAKITTELKKQYAENSEKPGYPLEKEKNLLAALRKGDNVEAKKILNELLAVLFFANPGQFKYIQLRITELIVLISRMEISPVRDGDLCMEINCQHLKIVQEAKTIEELTDIIHNAVDRVSGIISTFQGIPHAAALRKAENFIQENFTNKISLKEIADIAGLSPPYFSTVFKEEMGENLSKYLNRLRVEKASRLLLETDMFLNEIAACCCFKDQSWFSKIFKAFTGVSPGKYRNQGGVITKKISRGANRGSFESFV
jgi:AraC-like DNA-binding protein/ligand-binding sensor protein